MTYKLIEKEALYDFIREHASEWHLKQIRRRWGKHVSKRVKEINWQLKKIQDATEKSDQEALDKAYKAVDRILNTDEGIKNVLGAYLYNEMDFNHEMFKNYYQVMTTKTEQIEEAER